MKPLHRSLTFWSGAVVLVFLLWIWADSYRTRSRVVIRPEPDTLKVAVLERGDLEFFILVDRATDLSAGEHGIGFQREDATPPDLIRARDYCWRGIEEDPDPTIMISPIGSVEGEEWTVLPYAIVPGVFCLLWLALLTWRRHRYRRLAAGLRSSGLANRGRSRPG